MNFRGTSDRNKVEQVSFTLKYVHDHQCKEVIVGYVDAYEKAGELNCSKLTGQVLSKIALSFLHEIGVDPSNMVCCIIDTASIMSGREGKAIAFLKRQYPI